MYATKKLLMGAGISVAMALSGLSAATPDSEKPCSLVTPAEAERVLGAPVAEAAETPQKPSDHSHVRTCIFRSESGKTLTIFVGSKTKADFEKERQGHQDVPGLGESAYVDPPNVVSFYKNNMTVVLQGVIGRGSDLENLKSLAKIIAGRI